MNHTNDSCWNEHPRRNYQDTVFHMLFSERENAIELFNALEGTDYGPDTEVKFTTLEDAIYAGLKNDLGFIINRKFLVLSEAQLFGFSTKKFFGTCGKNRQDEVQ